METHSLVCHPDTPAKSVETVSVQIARGRSGEVVATYMAISEAGTILIPALAAQACRTDELWKTTCFEAFVRRDDGVGYYELNFAPSTNWAAYSFADYRNGMADALIEPPHGDVAPDPYRLGMRVSVDVAALPGLSPRAGWPLALSAVIEEMDGTKSYWALAHPPGKPDFHHPACFTALLAAPDDT